MIVKKEKVDGVMVYHVKKEIPDEKIEKILGTYTTARHYPTIIDHDADVYDADTGETILKFRKNVLSQKNVEDFYEAVIKFAQNKTANRGIASGSGDIKDVAHNKKIASNIIGYFDTYTIFQKHMFKTLKIKPPSKVRLTRFTQNYPDKWERCIPLIQDIDRMYKKLAPKEYKFQRSCADQTAFKIPNTAFSTVTTNLTYHTAVHTDSNNLKGTLGNLAVIEKGKYSGGCTGFVQYKVAVDVRTGDFLLMDIHRPHSNIPIKKLTKDAERLSIVSYLRQGVYENSKGSSPADVEKNRKTMLRIIKRYNKKREAMGKHAAAEE